MSQKSAFWKQAIQDKKDRISQPNRWYPFPVLIVVGLALLTTLQVTFSINPRLGNPTTMFAFDAPTQKDSSIWVSVSPSDKDIIVTTNDRKVFKWKISVTDPKELEKFVSYLKNRVVQETINAALAKEVQSNQIQVVLAVDRTLKYIHVRPIIYALAQANITNYAFETQKSAG